MNAYSYVSFSMLLGSAALVGCAADAARDWSSGELSAADTATAWPSGNIYLRAGDRYPRSSTAVFYTPAVADDGTATVRFGLAPNDAAADSHVVSGDLEATATIDPSNEAVAHFTDGSCALTFRASNPGDPMDATIVVEQSGACRTLGGADTSGTYHPTMIGD